MIFENPNRHACVTLVIVTIHAMVRQYGKMPVGLVRTGLPWRMVPRDVPPLR